MCDKRGENIEEKSSMGEKSSFSIRLSSNKINSDSFSYSDTDLGSEYSREVLHLLHTDCTDEAFGKKSGKISKEAITTEEITTDTAECSKKFTELDSKDEKFFDSKEAITEHLLKHYKTLKLFGVSFNWLAIHKIYRLILVACNTYISHSVVKLCTMTSFLLGIILLHFLLRPYKQRPANVTATFSYLANCGIAIINLIKAGLSEYGCQANCSDKSIILQYLDTAEKMLLVYVPIASVCLWTLSEALQKCMQKAKSD